MLINAMLWLGIWGERLGLSLIGLVSIWDLLITGARGFFEYAIGWQGVVAIWLGIGLICMGKRIDKGLK